MTSHVFGRNRRETHQIPEECWIKYCRKLYQRQKYRCSQDWFETHLLLVDGKLDRQTRSLGRSHGLTGQSSFARRGRRQGKPSSSNSWLGTVSRERFLLPCVGQNKTSSEIDKVVDVIKKRKQKSGRQGKPSSSHSWLPSSGYPFPRALPLALRQPNNDF